MAVLPEGFVVVLFFAVSDVFLGAESKSKLRDFEYKVLFSDFFFFIKHAYSFQKAQ